MKNNIEEFHADIPQETAKNAFYATSFDPGKRGEQVIKEYAETLFEDFEEFNVYAEKTGGEFPEELFSEYREGYKARTLNWLSAASRCMSSMITGPANFPTERNRKRVETEFKRIEERGEYRARMRKKILEKIHPLTNSAIFSGDKEAVKKLEEKIAKLEANQERMKSANSAIRKNANAEESEKIAALAELGFNNKQSVELLKPNCFGGIGFADFSLRNNNANIRRLKKRLEHVKRLKAAAPIAPIVAENGTRVEDCPAENRVRIFFNGKPEADVRNDLKHFGFRWTPSLGCWQAYRNARTFEKAKSFAEIN